MSDGMKMAASAIIAAAVTAALFLTLGRDDVPPVPPSPAPAAAEEPDPPPPVPSLESGELSFDGLPVVEGDGAITVRVLTPEGQPVPGVVAIAVPLPVRGDSPVVPPDRSLEEAMRKALADAWRRESGRRRATTGEDGVAKLTRLSDAAHSVRAFADGFTIRAARGQSTWGVKPGATVTFTATAVARVRFEVTNADPDPEQRITVVRAESRKDLAWAGGGYWSADRPVLTLPPGKWWVQARQGRPTIRESEPVEITLVAGTPEVTVPLALVERPGLRGKLTAKGGVVLQNVRLWALRFDGDEPPRIGVMSSRSAARGRFDSRTSKYHFDEIRPGRWFVWVTLHGDRPMGSAIVDIDDRMVEQDIEVAVEDREAYVSVRVLGPDGKPVGSRAISVSTSYRGPKMSVGGGGEAIPHEDGTWLVRHHEQVPTPEEAPGGSYRIRVQHRVLGFQEKVYIPGKDRELVFRFGKPATLVVRMPGLKAAGLTESVRIYLKSNMQARGMSFSSQGVAPAGETFTFDQVQPGDWFVLLVCGPTQADRKKITVREGENRIDWPLPTFHTVTVLTPEGARVGSLEVTRRDDAGAWTHQFTTAKKSGRTVLGWLPAGRYEVSTSIDGEPCKAVFEVPGRADIRLE